MSIKLSIDYQFIKQAAAEVGFDACGIAEAGPLPPDCLGLDAWIADGCQADMAYMSDYAAMRHDPALLYPGARTVISVLLGYKPSSRMEGPVMIAQYAYGEDYHERVKRMLYQLIAAIRRRYPLFEAKPCVDTAPISDKLWAARAGLGWIGHDTLLVNAELGSYCFVGELVTEAVADHYDTPVEAGCGSCTRCVDACPNQALRYDAASGRYRLDARRCASYHTVENRVEQLPRTVRLSGYAFGCDCCQLACPVNQAAAVRYELTDARKAELEALKDADESAYRRFVRHSAMNRVKYPQWKRNSQAG